MDEQLNEIQDRVSTLMMDETFRNNLQELLELCNKTARLKGWWNPAKTIGEQLALYHAEISEALEEYRNGHAPHQVYFVHDKPEGFPVELADCLIRIFDTCGQNYIPLWQAVFDKMTYNLSRSYRHGGKVI